MSTPNNTKLHHIIKETIQRADTHSITFAEFMELALYHPTLGYYCNARSPFGRSGDFVTASEISPLFAKCIAQQCQSVLSELGGGDILEIGAGSGRFAVDLLIELEKNGVLPNTYFIFEKSQSLQDTQHHTLQSLAPHLLSRVQWLDAFPTQPINGVIFANEVLDAMPFHCFQIEKNTPHERCVTFKNEQFEWEIQPAHHDVIDATRALLPLPNGYHSEINLHLSDWITEASRALNKGLILLIDYGYPQAEYYRPDRTQGTLMCFHEHHKHDNPFIWIGSQDITAHVNFTAVAEYASSAQLTVAGFTTQAGFLLACGLTDLIEKNLSPIDECRQTQAIKMLTLPSQMGEIIKAIGLTREINTPLLGFMLHDRRRDL